MCLIFAILNAENGVIVKPLFLRRENTVLRTVSVIWGVPMSGI